MSPTFGSRVIGDDAYDKAVRSEKGGASVFGSRVVGSIEGDGPIAMAKRNSQHGPLVVNDTKYDGLSIEETKAALDANATFFDSLYEGELARDEGPRDEALKMFRTYELKGQNRTEILGEIRKLLGEDKADAHAQADVNAAFLKQRAAQLVREAENKVLGDADRLQALRDRDENLKILRESASAGTQSQVDQATNLPDTEAQADAIVASGAAGGATEGSEIGDEDKGDEQAEKDLASATIEQLVQYLGDEEVGKLKAKGGTGSDGALVKADYVKAARRKMRSGQ